jgi:hypothetical protein
MPEADGETKKEQSFLQLHSLRFKELNNSHALGVFHIQT